MPDRDHIEELKTVADQRRVAEALGLRSRGKRFFCPSCQPQGGKTPDLAVTDKGFVCHKCGLQGDAFALVMAARSVDFKEAVAFLEELTGRRRPGLKKGGCQGKGRVEIAALQPSYAVGTVEKTAGKREKPDPAVYEAFLSRCRPVEGRALEFLTKDKGISPAVIEALGVRFCGREYRDIMDELAEAYGKDALLTAGLLKLSKAGRPRPLFWHYYAKKAGFLVIPYLDNGRPVYLKARPPVSKEKAEALGLARFMNTAGVIPCLYNVDALKAKPDRVLVCEGESDTWTALSCGFAAVGSPGARDFKEAWVELFRDFRTPEGRSTVYLVFDVDKAGTEGARAVAGLFLKAGLPVPLEVKLPAGKDLNEFMKGGLPE